MAKFTPLPAGVAPSGNDCPGVSFLSVRCSSGMRSSGINHRADVVQPKGASPECNGPGDLRLLRAPSALRRTPGGCLTPRDASLQQFDRRRANRVEPLDFLRRQRETVMTGSHEV